MPDVTINGLTTNEAPFIEQARHDGRLFIDQPYELYTQENHRAWAALYARMTPRWARYANPQWTLYLYPRTVCPSFQT
jgi:phenylalanine-4-hydroxylase